MSKGSKQRKAQVSNDQVEHNWKKIFKTTWEQSKNKDTLHDLDQRLDEQSERINRNKK